MKRDMYTKLNFEIPNDAEMHEKLKEVDEKSIIEAESRKMRGFCSWMFTTVATVYLENLVKFLSLKMTGEIGESSIDFCDLISCSASTRTNEDAEKEGNINISFRPGDFILNLLESDIDKEEFINIIRDEYKIPSELPDMKEIHSAVIEKFDESMKILYTIDKTAQKEIYEKNGFVLPDPWLATKIAFIYVKQIYIHLLRLMEDGSRAASINFQDLIEFHCRLVNENSNEDGSEERVLKFILRPGVNAKLFIKSDEITEFGEE